MVSKETHCRFVGLMDRIEHTMEFDKEVLNPRLEQKITYKMHSVEKNQPFDPLCHRHPLFLVNQAPEKDIEYPKYAPGVYVCVCVCVCVCVFPPLKVFVT